MFSLDSTPEPLSGAYKCRSSPPEVLLRRGVLKICSKFTGEHPCRSAISIKLLCNFIEVALRHGYSPVTLLHIFRTPFSKDTSIRLLLQLVAGTSCVFHQFFQKSFTAFFEKSSIEFIDAITYFFLRLVISRKFRKGTDLKATSYVISQSRVTQ